MRFLLCVLLVISFHSTNAQKTRIDTTKYRINLPSYWKLGDKVWEILTDALPKVCPELVDKELCVGKCNPLYSIDLYISKPQFLYKTAGLRPGYQDQYDIRTYYSFTSSLYMKDTQGVIIDDMLLVDTDEVFSMLKTAQVPPPSVYSTKTMNPKKMSSQSGPQLLNSMEQLSAGIPRNGSPNMLYTGNEKLVIPDHIIYSIINSKLRALKE